MRHRQYPPLTKQASTSGFTLVELVVVMLILSIVGGISFFVVLESMRVYSRTQPRIEASYEANLVARRIMSDVRGIPDDQSIQSYGETKLEFASSTGERISYEYANGVLLRNSQPLAERLQGMAFGFESADGSTPASGSDIHLVRLKLVAQSAGETIPLALTIFPRGLQR